MNTGEMSQERISALVDGELSDGHMPVTFAALNLRDGQKTWDLYHRIGDVLRSDEMAISMSPDFATSLFSRLEAEPTVIAPVAAQTQAQRKETATASGAITPFFKRFSISSVAVAATVAVFAVISAPQVMVAMKSTPQQSHAAVSMAASASSSLVSDSAHEDTILRDPQIDQYLLAHQRFSPSAYSIAQYARPATFATDSDK